MPGETGDALHALSCALGYNVRWLMRALLAKARRALSWLLQMVAVGAEHDDHSLVSRSRWLVAAMARLNCWAGKLGIGRPAGQLALVAT